MPIDLHWPQIALRLALTLAAGGLLGAERSNTGHAAGLRTTLLVTLAASVAMIQMDFLLQTNGKPSDSYAVMDVMRLPLGILTGVGFIGAGAIMHKSEMVLGVTTAATLWFATVVGLCMGGGQLILGSVSAAIGFLVLWGARYLEHHVERYQLGELKINVRNDDLGPEALRERLRAADFRIKSMSVSRCVHEHERNFYFEVRWPSPQGNADVPRLVYEIEQLPGVTKVEWKAWGAGPQ